MNVSCLQRGVCEVQAAEDPTQVMNPAIAGSAVFSAADQISRGIKTSRNVTIQITTLANPRTYTLSGCCHHPPQPTIAQKTQEICSFSKISYTARGAVGILTYQILQNEQHVGELAIMFSVPFDYNLYKNWFALGIFEADIPCDYNLFKRMYYDVDGPFTRAKGTGSIIKHKDRPLVKGTMSAFGHSIIKVELWDE
ncbi:hypothetical protein AOLI_G00127010 [Acnodon oligacanthus]